MIDTSLIKSKLSCVDYLSSHGVRLGKNNRCVSPIRKGAANPTSFYVDPDGQWWYDFSSGKSGDVITLVAEMEYNGDLGTAIRHLARKYGIDAPQNPSWKSDIQRLCDRTAHYQAMLTQDDRNYLHGRHLADEDISRLRIGRVDDGYLKGRLFLPYFKGDPLQNAPVVYYATRHIKGGRNPDAKYMKASLDESPSYENIPWGLHTLRRIHPTHPDTLIIAEGYFDAVMWEQAGYPVLSAITGRFSSAQIPNVLAACRMFKRVFIIYDTDRTSGAGEGFTRSMAEILIKHHIRFDVGHTPDIPGVKDVNDYVCSGGDVDTLLNNAEDGLSYVAATLPDLDSVETFVMSLCRYLSRSKLALIGDALIPKYGAEPVKQILLRASHGPSEDMICNEILDQHQIIYVPAVGFHEYDGRVWHYLDDEVVQRYADILYGIQFTSATKIRAVASLLRARTAKDVQFNREPVITFLNGTLDIRLDSFRTFSPNDYCTIILPYNFDREASCPAWRSFVADISNENAVRASLLQEMAGYVISPNNDLQKFFVLQGEGGNGKSLFLEILTAVFGEDNTVSIPPEGLANDFKRIKLKDALVNIVADVRPNFARDGVREYTLQICDGSRMSACYKGKDFVEFRTRAKLFFATNPVPYADVVQGLTRRFVFCKFMRRYVENPDPSNPLERPIDTELKQKLLAEISGIFTWAYDGYKDLMRAKQFSIPPEQAEMVRQFEIVSDPVISFCDEYDGYGDVPRDEIYDEYKEWCIDSGHKPLSRERFFPRFRDVMGTRVTGESRRRFNGSFVRFMNITYRDPLA